MYYYFKKCVSVFLCKFVCIWAFLCVFGRIWAFLSVFGQILANLRIFWAKMGTTLFQLFDGCSLVLMYVFTFLWVVSNSIVLIIELYFSFNLREMIFHCVFRHWIFKTWLINNCFFIFFCFSSLIASLSCIFCYCLELLYFHILCCPPSIGDLDDFNVVFVCYARIFYLYIIFFKGNWKEKD